MTTVLIVDDEEAFLHITQVILQRAGYSTLVAADGFAALSMVESDAPDLIILDEMMPGMTGSEVCMQVRRMPERQHIPILMHTAASKLKDPDRIRDIGANGLLFKPSLPREIVEAVSRFIPAGV